MISLRFKGFDIRVRRWIRSAVFVWLGVGLLIYFLYGSSHSRLQKGIDTGETENILPVIEP